MKTTITILLMSMLMIGNSSILYAQSASLEITITGIRKMQGSIRASLFKEKSTYLKEEYKGKVAKVNGKTMTLLFENLPVGEYALSVIHDENENGELDSNFMGIPNEGFGFGNNALGRFGPPDYEKTVVKIIEGLQRQTISVEYIL